MTNDNQKQIQLFGKSVSKARKQQGLTQEQLAEATGLGRRTIQHIEKGERWPKLETLLLISRKLKVKPEEFFKDLK